MSQRESAASAGAPEPVKSPRVSVPAVKPEVVEKPPAEAPNENVVVKVSMTDFFPDNCERYQKECPCCHCQAVRRALREAAYLQSPEGRDRLELKMHLKSLIMDINAITYVRDRVQSRLHGAAEYPPPASMGFPVTITKVKPFSADFMVIEWYIHDDHNATSYEIYVDSERRKRIYNTQLTSTLLPDVDMTRAHKLLMKAVPKRGLGSQGNPADRLVCDVCCGDGFAKVLERNFFCDCDKKSKMEKIQEQYKRNSCRSLIDHWKDSEFLYFPYKPC